MTTFVRCDAPGCGEEIDDHPLVATYAVTLRGAPGWSYQQHAVPLGGGAYGYENLLGGARTWELGAVPTFHACSSEHLLDVLKAAPEGATVVRWYGLEVKAAALAAVLRVLAAAEAT